MSDEQKPRKPTTRQGDSYVGGNQISAGGDYVGRDKIGGDRVGRDKITIGATGDDIAKLFDNVYKRIEQLPAAADKAEVRDAVDAIKEEAVKEATLGEPANEKMVKFSAQSLIKMAPDILDVIAASLASPAAGVAAVIRKVIDKARAEPTG